MQIKNIVAVLATVTAINAQVGIEPNATTPNATQPNATQPNATQPNATLPTASVTTTVSIGEAVVNTMAAGAFGAAIAAGVAFLF
ncbi:ANM_HP_G0224290.mRNA.1.CDS.1 [Saccharomyces cerevisiae]|nr:CFA_G0005070.mRNA.1.CDS.1 [Saccharomyces cerevisiae]CAI5128576.1 ANM_HP_G0224290.mRNA.1.CDS.1 [Saccharomyces cerevisiae]CAI6984924.1 ANM_HP_G0224290.mRNA.1.CDS.1 [Saccharomyces cerevisiae]CAI7163259.1 CFA_G0005070.mRNA.1.CDS.1 [Saccharomyces cerevisiae]